jgi:hypothetical protein
MSARLYGSNSVTYTSKRMNDASGALILEFVTIKVEKPIKGDFGHQA